MVLDAIENARNADSNPDGYMPELLQTKVYQLGRALYERMGKVRFEFTGRSDIVRIGQLIAGYAL